MEFVIVTEKASTWMAWKNSVESEGHREDIIISRAMTYEHLEFFHKQMDCGIVLWEVKSFDLESPMIAQVRKLQSLGWLVVGIFSSELEIQLDQTLETWIHIFDDCFKEKEWCVNQVMSLLYKPRSAEDVLLSFRPTDNIKSKSRWERDPLGKRVSIAEQLKHSKVCVWGNPTFAYELAVFMSDVLMLKTLIIDSDRMRPTADVYLNVKKHIVTRYEALTQTSRTGLNVMIDSLKKGVVNQLTVDSCCPAVKGHPNLKVMTGCYAYRDFEYYTKEEFQKVLDYAGKYHDIVIILVNEHLYDGFSAIARVSSDMNIAAYSSNPAFIRQVSSLAHFLKDSQNVSLNRMAYVQYSDSPDSDSDLFSASLLSHPFYLGRIKSSNSLFKSTELFSGKVPRFKKSLETQYYQLLSNWIKRRGAQ